MPLRTLMPAPVCGAVLFAMISGCATAPPPLVCSMPDSNRLEQAIAHTEADLARGCEANFDAYLESLLTIAEGDPGADNKLRFSAFLVRAAEQGVLSRRQAEAIYNRYFNVKFVSLAGDYNNCAYTCPREAQVMEAMTVELGHKERGLLRVAQDKDAYYRADRLLKQAELVLAATCRACAGASAP